MDKVTYDAVMIQIEQEKSDIQLEIIKLNQKIEECNIRKELELSKLNRITNLFDENKTFNSALIGRVSFNQEIIDQAEKEKDILLGYIDEMNSEYERVKEKERTLEQLLKKEEARQRKREEQLEEQLLSEYKGWIYRNGTGF